MTLFLHAVDLDVSQNESESGFLIKDENPSADNLSLPSSPCSLSLSMALQFTERNSIGVSLSSINQHLNWVGNLAALHARNVQPMRSFSMLLLFCPRIME